MGKNDRPGLKKVAPVKGGMGICKYFVSTQQQPPKKEGGPARATAGVIKGGATKSKQNTPGPKARSASLLDTSFLSQDPDDLDQEVVWAPSPGALPAQVRHTEQQDDKPTSAADGRGPEGKYERTNADGDAVICLELEAGVEARHDTSGDAARQPTPSPASSPAASRRSGIRAGVGMKWQPGAQALPGTAAASEQQVLMPTQCLADQVDKQAAADRVVAAPHQLRLANTKPSTSQPCPRNQLQPNKAGLAANRSNQPRIAQSSPRPASRPAGQVIEADSGDASNEQRDSDDSILQQVLEWSNKEALKTPSTCFGVRARSHCTTIAPHSSHSRLTAESRGMTSLRNKRRLTSSSKVSSAYTYKRRALLELLDQVEVVVQASGSSTPDIDLDISSSGQHLVLDEGVLGEEAGGDGPGAEVAAALVDRQASHQEASTSGEQRLGGTPGLRSGNGAGAAGVGGRAGAGVSGQPARTDTYMCSLQEYEDFLDSLDMDALECEAQQMSTQAQRHNQLPGSSRLAVASSNTQAQPLPPQAVNSAAWSGAGPPQQQPLLQQQAALVAGVVPAVQAGAQLTAAPVAVVHRAPLSDVQNLLHTQQHHAHPSEPKLQHSSKDAADSTILWPPGSNPSTASVQPAAQHTHVSAGTSLGAPPTCVPRPAPRSALAVAAPASAKHAPASAGGGVAAPGQSVALVGDRQHVYFHVLEVQELQEEKLLRLFSPYQGVEMWAHLLDMWQDVHVQPGDSVNLVGCRVQAGRDGSTHTWCSADQGLLVLHPDILLSGTAITSAMECPRKAWLSELFGGQSSAAALKGTLMHEVVQAALDMAAQGEACVSVTQLEAQVHATVDAAGPKLHEVQLDAVAVKAELLSKAPLIQSWAATYIQPQPSPASELRMGPGHKGPALQLCITSVADIEEQIWAPKYGLKGQLDGSLAVQYKSRDDGVARFKGRYSAPADHLPSRDAGQASGKPPARHSWAAGSAAQQHPWAAGLPAGGGPAQAGEQLQSAVVPFEFKSGRHHHSHRAQVSLYLLLMEDRYNQACDLGVLWNINDGPTMQAVSRVQPELAALVQHRNRLAAALSGTVRVPPPMLHNEYQCNRCFSKVACSTYHLAVEGGSCESSGLGGEAWHTLTAHLTEAHCRFFARWVSLVDMEESGTRERRHQLWSVPGPVRQTPGLCMANLQLQEYRGQVTTDSGAQHCYVFLHADTHHHGAGSTPQHAQHSSMPGWSSGNHVAHGVFPHQQQQQQQEVQVHRSRRISAVAVAVEAGGVGQGAVQTRHAGCNDVAAPGQQQQQHPQEVLAVQSSDDLTWFESGELVVLSLEGQHANVARVTIDCVSKAEVRVLSKKRIRLADQLLRQQACSGWPTAPAALPQQQQPCSQLHGDQVKPAAWTSGGPAAPQRQQPPDRPGHHDTGQAGGGGRGAGGGWWRLDRDEPSSGSVIMRSNLVELMSGSNPLTSRLRQLVVDLQPPGKQTLHGASQACSSVSYPCLTQKVADGQLNPDQAAAVRSILEMQDYSLVLGMPGTGKTSTIVEAIHALLRLNRTILLTAYTNSAVDNIGIKLAAAGVPFVRVPGASLSSIHPDVRQYTPGGAHYPHGLTPAGFSDIMATVKVVAVTCLGLRHPLLARRTFDVCILDEASQVSLPACLGPLLRARTWVLVGDHYQLPPLVANPQAAAQGYGESLFRRLCEAHPQAVVTLRLQYRMATDIMRLSNQLIYNGALQCGSAQVAQACLHLPHLHQLATSPLGLSQPWVLQVLAPAARVVFIDTDGMSECEDVTERDAVYNTGEALLVQHLVAALRRAGLPAGHLGIVSTYRAQVSLLKKLIQHQPDSGTGGVRGQHTQQAAQHTGGQVEDEVEVLTIDKYQGRDKECIILSFVRSNAVQCTGRLLTDWQRINVALTRAKHKLVMLGSSKTLGSVPLLAAMLGLLDKAGCIMRLPADVLHRGSV